METAEMRECPGCGLRLPKSDALDDSRFSASPECLALHSELTGYTIAAAQTRSDERFIHQHFVDAYAAQHASDTQPPIRAAFALIGLYLACEKGYSGRQVQRMHVLLAKRSKQWPRFSPPASAGALTAQDVLRAEPGQPRDDALMRWACSVWQAWSDQHARVRALFDQVMAD